jgi:hypothetical protein
MVWPQPYAPAHLLMHIRARWLAGQDTLTIAKALKLRQAAVHNSLPIALSDHLDGLAS